MSRQSRLTAKLSATTELLTRADNALPSVLAVIEAETSAVHLKAQAYDAIRVSGFTTELDDDGAVIPVRPDPVGRAVANGLDRSDTHLADLERLVHAVSHATEQLLAALGPWQTNAHRLTASRAQLAREAADAALEEARSERENQACCRSCARIDKFAEVRSTTVLFGDPWPLCRWCYDHVRAVGNLPTREELADHHSGGKVRKRVAP